MENSLINLLPRIPTDTNKLVQNNQKGKRPDGSRVEQVVGHSIGKFYSKLRRLLAEYHKIRRQVLLLLYILEIVIEKVLYFNVASYVFGNANNYDMFDYNRIL